MLWECTWAVRLVRPIREVVRIGPSPPDPSYPKPNPPVLALSKLPDLPAARLDSKKPRLLAAIASFHAVRQVQALSKLPDLLAARLDSKKPRLLAAHRVLSGRPPILFRFGRLPRYTT